MAPGSPWQKRLFGHVRMDSLSGCWMWSGMIHSTGYGKIWANGKSAYAHRKSYELYHGPIPEGLGVLHHCDTRACVSPFHLYAGTQADNSRDARERNRLNCNPRPKQRGAGNGNSRFTAETILEILYSPLDQKRAAKEFGCAASWVQRVRTREVWANLEVDEMRIPHRRFWKKQKTLAAIVVLGEGK